MQMSNSNTGPSVPPGWYPDPAGTGRLRWWDGTNWTSQYSTPYSPAAQPGPGGGLYPVTPYFSERPHISSETPVYNPLIWIITLLPLLPVILLLLWNPEVRFISIGSQGTPAVDPLSVFTPVYFLLVFSGFLTYAASVLLAYFDSERLKRDGVVRPFHWAWSFLNSAVYVIGRSVIVHKVAPGRGLLPVWATIGVFVLSSVVSTIKMSALVSSVMSSLMSIPS
ncbi:DUF2510 domain-containing protein [Arthrobacter sp. CDRTa11]|uniref:DUF2510 domain-containing protein n=1 Tax=Arthrobacter sp. CDRTa11 TaxID=2651199 RepID=UPI002265D95D|nr:DUF2510 domain-containing protein [Arthrobacter sp. CDRTa11]